MNTCVYNTLLFLFVIGFLYGIKLMSSPKKAVKGNLLGAFSMLFAILVTLISHGIISQGILWISLAAGGLIGYMLAIKVAMIQMPQLVALLNGMGGGASAVTAFVVLGNTYGDSIITRFTGGLALLVGCVTLSGSMIAAAKLDQRIKQQPVILHGHTFLTFVVLFLMGIFLFFTTTAPWGTIKLLSILTLVSALIFGILFTIRIGGADMPITISLLNSFSGLAGSIAGFAIRNPLLVAVGAIVGAAGFILTRIMCRAMNRSLLEVVLTKTTIASTGQISQEEKKKGGPDTAIPETTANNERTKSKEIQVSFLRKAQKVVIVPGYGMALSQAQNEVKQLYDKLLELGKDVKFAIHPVAGRMPGHMNVLLAEVDIPYDRLYEMDDINPVFTETDVVIIVGANDVVNPAAKTAKNTPIYGMPILNTHESKHIIVCNIDTKPGYAGVENPLYELENVSLLLGDAKETVRELAEHIER